MGDTRRIGSALGSWLMRKLEDAGFGNGVIVKSVERRMEAGSLKELGDNLMGVKDMFYKGYSEDEIGRLPGVMGEEIRKLEAYKEMKGSSGIKMVAWVGFTWK
jgi:hypothetical protein